MLGRTHVSTTDAAPGEAVEYWIRNFGAHVNPLDIAVANDRAFHAVLETQALGPNLLARIEADYQRADYKPLRSSHGANKFDLLYVIDGFIDLDHYGTRAMLKPGDWAMVDNREPYSFETGEHCSCALLQMPDVWLRGFVPEPRDIVRSTLAAKSSWGMALGYAVRALTETNDLSFSALDTGVNEQLGGLFALAFPGRKAESSSHATALLRAIRRSMSEEYYRSDLSPEDAARRHGISKRYLHTLFAATGSSFCRELKALRLAKASTLLGDGRYDGWQIVEIANAVGMIDPVSFARAFEREFGCRPSLYRRRRATTPRFLLSPGSH
jgi:AraC-like DNA-binding protein